MIAFISLLFTHKFYWTFRNGIFLSIHIVNLYTCSKFNNIIKIGITTVIVAGLMKKPNNVKLSNIKLKNELILLVNSVGNPGIFIQPNTTCSNVIIIFKSASIIIL